MFKSKCDVSIRKTSIPQRLKQCIKQVREQVKTINTQNMPCKQCFKILAITTLKIINNALPKNILIYFKSDQ